MKFIGKIPWWHQKDQNAILVDPNGNEFYFDISVSEGRKTTNLKPETVIQTTPAPLPSAAQLESAALKRATAKSASVCKRIKI